MINKECTYVIKYYLRLNLIVIWHYNINHSMSYSLKTINEKLKSGIRYADKGKEFHTKKQCYVYFDKSEKLYELLNLVTHQL